MKPQTSKLIDQTLRVIAVSMGISSVLLLLTKSISAENAIILLGIGMIAMALEHLSESS